MTTRCSAIASALVLLSTIACTSSHHDTTCPKNQPAFRIQVTASDGPLPPDTELTVTYSGIEMESYSLMHGGLHNQDVCCEPAASPVSGPLPDVRCGLPLQVEGSTPSPQKDATTTRDTPAMRDAASSRDGALPPLLDASGPVMRDASTSQDASPPAVRDASLDSSGVETEGGSRQTTEPAAIFCDLWTNGVAGVVVTGTGYAKLHVVLDDPYVPDPRCGVQTVDHRLTLTHADGGVLQ